MTLEQLLGVQRGWRWCDACQVLFFAGGATTAGRCAATAGRPHNGRASGKYLLAHQVPGLGQRGWRWCSRCHGLYFAGTNALLGDIGPCPAHGLHSDTGSGDYTMLHGATGVGQEGWRWCRNCKGLFFPGTEPARPDIDVCPDGFRHDANGSGSYSVVDWDPQLRTRASWGAVAPSAPPVAVPITARTEFFVHFTDGPTNQTLRAIQNDHMRLRSQRGLRNFSDIGYNFLVDVAGNVYEGRGRDVVGAHCTDHNESGIGVAFIGRDGDATAPARWAIRRLWETSSAAAGRALAVHGHRDVERAPEAGRCPGDDLHRWLQEDMPLR